MSSFYPFFARLDITHSHEIPPVAVQAVLLVDKLQLALHLWPVFLQHVDDGVLVSKPSVIGVAGVCQLCGEDLEKNRPGDWLWSVPGGKVWPLLKFSVYQLCLQYYES